MASRAARPTLSQAVLKRWWLVLALALLLAGAGVAAGLLRDPTYQAQTQSNVGSIDARTQALPGFAEGAKSLASAYSRLARSDRVVTQVAAEVGRPVSEVRPRFDASPVPDSPIVTVTAYGDTGDEAAELANAGTGVLGREVRRMERAGDDSRRLLAQFRSRTQRANELEDDLARLRARRRADPGAVSRTALSTMETRAETERLRAQTTGTLYSEATARDQGAAEIRLLTGAVEPSSDRSAKLQQFALAGLLGGALLGAGLAALLEGRRQARLREA